MPSPQVPLLTKNLAFNVGLVAYDYQIDGRVPRQALSFQGFYLPSKLHRDAELRPYHVPNVAPSVAELALDKASYNGLWVGMRPSATNEPGSSLARDRGSVDHHSSRLTIRNDSKALRVIAYGNEYGVTGYYCLANQEDGLCKAYDISIDDVFFFKEYRDDKVKEKKQRKQEWSIKVEEALKLQLAVAELEVEQGDSTDDEDAIKTEDGDSNSEVKPLMCSMAGATQEQTTAPPEDYYIMLHKLASAIEVLSDEECEEAIQQFYIFAPGLEKNDYKKHEFRQVSGALVDAKLFLSEQMLRSVIVVSIQAYRNSNVESPIGEATMLKTHDTMRDALGPPVEQTTVYSDSNNRYFNAEIEKIRKRVKLAREYIDTATADGDEDSAKAVLPGLAKKEKLLRKLKARRDQSKRRNSPGTEGSQSLPSNGEERPLKRARLST